jgi:DNA-directed RNA polymerases I, II, and III subunit RPABC1
MDAETLRKYSLSYINMLKAIEYRGIKVPKSYKLTQQEFYDKYGLFEKVEDIKFDIGDLIFENKILLKWFKEKKLGASIRDTVDVMKENNIKHALIVADEGITPNCKEILKNLKICENIVISTWTLLESMVFVPEHEFVPKHEICTISEKRAIFKTYGLNKKQLPTIKADDVMCKYLGAERNHLIRIIRQSDTNPEYFILYYRLVV